MGFGLAVGEVKGALVTRGDSVATAGNAGRVKMMDAWLKAFLGTDRQSHLAPPQSTPLVLQPQFQLMLLETTLIMTPLSTRLVAATPV
jgi:hypothetical protein